MHQVKPILGTFALLVFLSLSIYPAVWSNIEASPRQSDPSCIHIDQNRFMIDQSDFHAQGFNYYHRSENWTNFWPFWHTDAGKLEVETELRLAQALGTNSIRIFLTHDYFHAGDGQIHLSAKEDLHQFLSLSDQLGLKVLITLFDQMPVGGDDSKQAQYSKINESLSILTDLLTPFDSNGETVDFSTDCRILGWDVKNEIDRDYAFDTNEDGEIDTLDTETVQTWASAMLDLLNREAVQPTTISTISVDDQNQFDEASVLPFLPHIDFISIHYYLYDFELPLVIDRIVALSGGKPVMIQEIGIPSEGENGTRDERDQAAYLNTALSIAKAKDLAGTLLWTLVDFERVPNDIFVENPLVLHMGIVVYDQDLDSYQQKIGYEVVQNHFAPDIVYLDMFSSFVDPNTCDQGVIGWRTNAAAQISACPPESERAFRPLATGHARFTKLAPDNSPLPGQIFTPAISPTLPLESMLLEFTIKNYSIEDPADLSGPIWLDVGLKLLAEEEVFWLREDIDPSGGELEVKIPLSAGFAGSELDPQLPQPFEILFQLESAEDGKNGYSAGFELDEVRISQALDFRLFLPQILEGNPSP